jgi:hypothetical protein
MAPTSVRTSRIFTPLPCTVSEFRDSIPRTIMRFSLSLAIALLLQPLFSTRGQVINNNNQSSAGPADARFEIVQSNIAVKFTVRLDRYSGNVDELVVDDSGELNWRPMNRVHHSLKDSILPEKVNYQIFTSGVALKSTFLMNVNTGATWVFTEDTKTGERFWNPVPKAKAGTRDKPPKVLQMSPEQLKE